jgi:hypothetical protein
MAATNFTPISLYYSTTATTIPSSGNLVSGELALNIANADMSIYTKNASGTVKLLFNNPAALKYPTADGTTGQAVVTNGAGVLSFGSAGISTGKAIAMAMIFGF